MDLHFPAIIAVIVISLLFLLAVSRGIFRWIYASAEVKIRLEFAQRENQLALEHQQLRNDAELFKKERQRRIDEMVRLQLEEKERKLQDEYDEKYRRLRGRYAEERDILRDVQKELAAKACEQERKAEIAEKQFHDEFEKWKERNRVGADDSDESAITLSPDQMAAFGYIAQTRSNFFIQGPAGSGKSTLVQFIKNHAKKSLLLASPTGVAAKVIGGSTLHRIFGLPVGGFLDNDITLPIRNTTKALLRAAEILIIDEVSMVRPDVLDAIDRIAKSAREDPSPFGGLQVVLIGDLFQLPPVITDNESEVFKIRYGYENAFFFDAPAYKTGHFTKLELTSVHRQRDDEFLKQLDNIIHRRNPDEVIEYFSTAKIQDEEIRRTAMHITPTNRDANRINFSKLADIPLPEQIYVGVINGRFKVDDAPAPVKLKLKIGALVVFTNNSQGVINGTMAVITDFNDSIITVRFIENDREAGITRDIWTNYEYTVDRLTGEIEEIKAGTFEQYPMQLGYAMTVHKAQGRTLDKVVIDMNRGAFAHGQLYVALSRTRRKADMHLERPLRKSDIIIDKRVINMLSTPVCNQ